MFCSCDRSEIYCCTDKNHFTLGFCCGTSLYRCQQSCLPICLPDIQIARGKLRSINEPQGLHLVCPNDSTNTHKSYRESRLRNMPPPGRPGTNKQDYEEQESELGSHAKGKVVPGIWSLRDHVSFLAFLLLLFKGLWNPTKLLLPQAISRRVCAQL